MRRRDHRECHWDACSMIARDFYRNSTLPENRSEIIWRPVQVLYIQFGWASVGSEAFAQFLKERSTSLPGILGCFHLYVTLPIPHWLSLHSTPMKKFLSRNSFILTHYIPFKIMGYRNLSWLLLGEDGVHFGQVASLSQGSLQPVTIIIWLKIPGYLFCVLNGLLATSFATWCFSVVWSLTIISISASVYIASKLTEKLRQN